MPRLKRWLTPETELAGAVDQIAPESGLSGWVVSKSEPSRSFTVAVVAGGRALAQAETDVYRADLSALVHQDVNCGFSIPWSKFDLATVKAVLDGDPEATFEVSVPALDACLHRYSDTGDLEAVRLRDCVQYMKDGGQAHADPIATTTFPAEPPETDSPGEPRIPHVGSWMTKPRLHRWLAPQAEFAGAVDKVSPASGLSGWVVSKSEPSRSFTVAVVAGGRALAQAETDVYRADLSALVHQDVNCGFAIPWSKFDLAAVKAVLNGDPEATFEVSVPDLDAYLHKYSDTGDLQAVRLGDCLQHMKDRGLDQPEPIAVATAPVEPAPAAAAPAQATGSSPGDAQTPQVDSPVTKPRLPRWLAPEAEFAGALDHIGPASGLNGWVLSKSEPSRTFAVAVIAGGRALAQAETDVYRADLSALVHEKATCGFSIPWSKFDVAAVAAVLDADPEAMFEVLVPDLNVYLRKYSDAADLEAVRLGDCFQYMKGVGLASADPVAATTPNAEAPETDSPAETRMPHAGSDMTKPRLQRWLAPKAEFAGAVDQINPASGLNGWVLSKSEPSRRFTVAVVAGGRTLAEAQTDIYRADLSALVNEAVTCGFAIPWSKFDPAAVAAVLVADPEAMFEVFVPELDAYLHKFSDAADLEAVRLNDWFQYSSPSIKSNATEIEAPVAAKFDAEFYLRSYKDVADAKINPEYHYLTRGEREGRRPNSLFDPKFYARTNPDVTASASCLFDHFRHYGWREGRLPSNPADFLCNYKGRKNILFFGHDAIQAGAQSVLADIIRWFGLHTDYHVYLVLSDVGSMISNYARYADVYVFHNYEIVVDDRVHELLDVRFEFAYANTVRSGKAATVIMNKLQHKTKLICHLHELENVLMEFKDDLNLLVRNSDLFIVVNPTIRDYLINKLYVDKNKIIVETPFITAVCAESDPIIPHRKEAREQLHVSQDVFVVAGCGTAYSRKGIDLFVEAGIRAVRDKHCRNAHFVWFGDGQDLAVAQARVFQAGLSAYFSFPGHRSDANRLLACADIFVLSSREDPFPLVCLEAAHFGAPIIHFDKGTGIGAFVQANETDASCGMEVAAFSPDAISDAIYTLYTSPELRQRLGQRARKRLFSEYEAERKLIELWKTLVDNGFCAPSVSVVVPNFNHEKYLDKRLTSIISQSIKSLEIIILDDASTDNSRRVIDAYTRDRRVRTIYNESNSGSPFKQWERGLRAARAEVVWIAESDDFADVDFCKNLIGAFADKDVAIAVGKTIVVNSAGDIVVGALDTYLNRAEINLFRGSWVKDGVEFVRSHFSVMCTLVNASGLLMRKSVLENAIESASDFKMCGDWMTYLKMFAGTSTVAFSEGAINYFRRHADSAVHLIEGTPTYFRERFQIASFAAQTFYLSAPHIRRMVHELRSEWDRFSHKNPGRVFGEFIDERILMRHAKMRRGTVALYVHGMNFSKGGIERVAAQLCAKLVEVGYRAIVYCSDMIPGSPVYSLPQSVQVKHVNIGEAAGVDKFASFLRADGVDVFIPMLSEWLFERAIEAGLRAGVKIIASEHNDPWQIEKKWWNREARERYFSYVDRIHLLMPLFIRSLPPYMQSQCVCIPNGISIGPNFSRQSTCEAKRIICIARLSEQKRLDILIDAFALLEARFSDWTVEIFGDGELRASLTRRISDLGLDERVHLRGLTDDVHSELVDAGLFVLPSEFEGLGIVVLEAQRAGLPCVAFRDCNGPNQLIEHGVNGLLAGEMSAESLSLELEVLMRDASLRAKFGANGRKSCEHYNVDRVLNQWIKMIDGLMCAQFTPKDENCHFDYAEIVGD